MKPEQYILDEWEAMCAKANTSCPLIEDEVLVKMHQYIGSLKKIAQEVVGDISKRSYQRDWDSDGEFPIDYTVEINEKLDKLLNELDELSRDT